MRCNSRPARTTRIRSNAITMSSEGWHIYDCPIEGEPRRLKTVTTPAQARKSKRYYPSVTGVLGLLPNPFIQKWRGRKLLELREQHPDVDVEQLEEMAWGMRTCPATGEQIPSSDFGTAAHSAIENYFANGGQGGCAYWDTATATIDYLEDNFTFRAAESILVCHALRIAGTVDYIGKDQAGNWMLADFKFRAKNNTYDKDLAQLAVEARMLRDDYELDYDPDIYSIVVVDGVPHPKKWSDKMKAKGLQIASTAANLYWSLPGYGYEPNS